MCKTRQEWYAPWVRTEESLNGEETGQDAVETLQRDETVQN